MKKKTVTEKKDEIENEDLYKRSQFSQWLTNFPAYKHFICAPKFLFNAISFSLITELRGVHRF